MAGLNRRSPFGAGQFPMPGQSQGPRPSTSPTAPGAPGAPGLPGAPSGPASAGSAPQPPGGPSPMPSPTGGQMPDLGGGGPTSAPPTPAAGPIQAPQLPQLPALSPAQAAMPQRRGLGGGGGLTPPGADAGLGGDPLAQIQQLIAQFGRGGAGTR